LSRLEFLSDATIATIDIENDNTDAELKLLEKCSNASQDTKQFLVRELSSPNIIGMDLKKSIHPNSSVWYGQVKFDPLDSKENKAKFNFRINKKVIRDTYNFTFDVNTSRQFIIKD
jgi:hypothetical protein